MALEYTDLDQLRISEIKTESLNQTFSKMVRNDMALLPNTGVSPGVWERKWYNDDSVAGYSEGDAVWLNTEDIDEFVKNKESDIYAYAEQNQQLKQKLDDLSSAESTSDRYSLMKKFVTGEYDPQKGCLYYLGELTDRVQIRISRTGNNKTLPTDDNAWYDFFEHYEDADVELSIRQQFDIARTSALADHILDYHLSGAYEAKDISAQYLLADMSNISGEQKFNSHFWYDKTMDGFDRVKVTVSRKYSGGRVKQFKIWASGLLEHSGIVMASDPEETGDSSDGRVYTVRLDWEYGSGSNAMTYDYPSTGFIAYYGAEKYVESGSGVTEIPSVNVGTEMRYDVRVTPFKAGGLPYATDPRQLETCFYRNSSFGFVLPPGCDSFSYSVRGYSKAANRM